MGPICNLRQLGGRESGDPHLGMCYLRARYYKPNTGRFWTMDSFEGYQDDPQSLHLYAYAADNPVKRIDPSGLYCFPLFWGEEISASMGEVPFEDAAKTKKAEILNSPDFKAARYFFVVHHSPGIMHLGMSL